MVQRRGAPEFSGEMIGWVLSGFSWVLMGSQWVLMGSQWVLSGYSDCALLGSQGVLRQAPPMEMVINIERTGFVVLARIVTNGSRSKISRFKRNMPAYESVLSDLKTQS